MNRKLTRRRFARLAVVGGVAVGSIAATSVPFASTIFARLDSATLLAASTGPIASDDSEAPTPSVTVPIVLETIDLTTGQRHPMPVPQFLTDGSPVLEINQALTGCVMLSDGTVVLAISPVAGSRNEKDPTRLTTFVGGSARTITVSGLGADERLADLVGAADGSLLGLVSRRNGNTPAKLVNLDPGAGRIGGVQVVNLPNGWRLDTVAQSPGGQLLGAVVGRQGETNLVQLSGRGNQTTTLSRLNANGIPWNNGLQNLVFTPSGQLIALGALRGVTPNALYSVDVQSGAMRKLFDFDTVRVTSARA
jgi:hypothetical protein